VRQDSTAEECLELFFDVIWNRPTFRIAIREECAQMILNELVTGRELWTTAGVFGL